MAKKFIDVEKAVKEFAEMTVFEEDEFRELFDMIEPADVQEVKHGRWKFKTKTKLVPTDELAIKEGYCQVNNHNLSKSVLILKKRITVKEPICSVCGYRGYDECDATAYCPNCSARMDGDKE